MSHVTDDVIPWMMMACHMLADGHLLHARAPPRHQHGHRTVQYTQAVSDLGVCSHRKSASMSSSLLSARRHRLWHVLAYIKHMFYTVDCQACLLYLIRSLQSSPSRSHAISKLFIHCPAVPRQRRGCCAACIGPQCLPAARAADHCRPPGGRAGHPDRGLCHQVSTSHGMHARTQPPQVLVLHRGARASAGQLRHHPA